MLVASVTFFNEREPSDASWAFHADITKHCVYQMARPNQLDHSGGDCDNCDPSLTAGYIDGISLPALGHGTDDSVQSYPAHLTSS